MTEQTSDFISPADPALLLQLGRVSTQWAILERLLTSAIAKLSGLDEQKAVCMFTNLGAQQKLEILSCLVGEYYHSDEEKYDEFHELDIKIDLARDLRNNLQHCVLEESDDGTLDYVKFLTRGRKKDKRGVRSRTISICEEDARSCADQIQQASLELTDFVNACVPEDEYEASA